MQFSCFVTGTDTGAGKTHASVALLHGLRRLGRRALGMKPVASGAVDHGHGLRNEDALDLISVSKRKGNWDLKLDDAKTLLSLRVDFEGSKVNDLLQVDDE